MSNATSEGGDSNFAIEEPAAGVERQILKQSPPQAPIEIKKEKPAASAEGTFRTQSTPQAPKENFN